MRRWRRCTAPGLLHRDVKAQNVMRESGGRLVLMDFGTGEELPGTNRLVGTPLYLAPEIFRGQRASVQSDLYSVGVLLFYLVTWQVPVNAGSMEQLARAHAHRERQPLRDLRPDLPEGFIAHRRARARQRPEPALSERRRVRSRRCGSPSMRRRRGRPFSRPRPLAAGSFGLAFLAAAAVLVALVAALIVWTGRTACSRARPSTSLAVLPLVDRIRSLSTPVSATRSPSR